MKRVIGLAMIAAPFVALFVWGGMGLGWMKIAAVFGGIAILGVWVGIATYLID